MSYVDQKQSGNALGRLTFFGSVVNTVVFFVFSALGVIQLMNMAMLLALVLVVLGLVAVWRTPRKLAAIGLALGCIPLWLPIVVIAIG